MPERLSGHTELIGLFATPIRHSLSPTMHNEAFAKLGLDYAYLAFEVGNEELPAAIEGLKALKLRGANVSMPNKVLVCDYLDHLSPAAQLVGAVNTIVNDDGVLTGHITDGTGYMRNLKENNIDVIGKKMTIVGAGGAATAISIQASLDGVREIAMFNRRDAFWARAEATAAKINSSTSTVARLYDLADDVALRAQIADSAVLANASSVGMKPLEGQSVITDPTMLRPDLVVTDVVYIPAKSHLLEMADAAGCRYLSGLGMMLWQGAAAFKLWTGQDMPVDYVRNLLF